MERYNRNILLIGEEGQEKLSKAKILVCGCGGLGSTVIFNLASLGIGEIGLVDNDVVEDSNLNRQFIHDEVGLEKVISAKSKINKFNPEIKVNTYKVRLSHYNYIDIVEKYDILIDCFDSYESKFLLNDISVKTEKTLIHGGVSEFFGQVTVIKPTTACLRCFLTNIDTENEISKGVLSPAVSTIGAIQSMEAAKQVLQIGEPLENILLTYNGLKNEFKHLKITKNKECICQNKDLVLIK